VKNTVSLLTNCVLDLVKSYKAIITPKDNGLFRACVRGHFRHLEPVHPCGIDLFMAFPPPSNYGLPEAHLRSLFGFFLILLGLHYLIRHRHGSR